MAGDATTTAGWPMLPRRIEIGSESSDQMVIKA
jgi:hypothetical protein